MFKEYFDASTYVELIEEYGSEDGLSHKAVFRVVDEAMWGKGLIRLLKTQKDDPDFGISVQKQYYLSEEGAPSFVWVLLVWGDLEDAKEEIGKELGKKAGPPPKPKGARHAVATPLRKRTIRTSEGWTRTETVVPLPHTRGSRDVDPSTVMRPGTKGLGATVTTGIKE
jgi:hypothetical protein